MCGYRSDPEGAPDEGYMDTDFDGVTISSRCHKSAEISLMERVFRRPSTPRRWLIDIFWCDSKAGSSYSIVIRPGYDDPLRLPRLEGKFTFWIGDTTVMNLDWGELAGLRT